MSTSLLHVSNVPSTIALVLGSQLSFGDMVMYVISPWNVPVVEPIICRPVPLPVATITSPSLVFSSARTSQS